MKKDEKTSKERFHADYLNIIFDNPMYTQNFSLVYFPSEYDKRHADETYRNLISDLRVLNLQEWHVEYLQELGSNIENLKELRNGGLIVNGSVLVKNKQEYIFSENENDKKVVLKRKNDCLDAYKRIHKDWIWPAGNVQILYSETKQHEAYNLYYSTSLKANKSILTKVFKATTKVIAYKNDEYLLEVVINDLNWSKYKWYKEIANMLPDDEIVIVEGNTYSISINSKQGHRHEAVKVLNVNKDEVIQR